ncbi:MAG: hypothetical protein ACI37S_08200 [Candidatus Gastranaerophilaceae bacterium]
MDYQEAKKDLLDVKFSPECEEYFIQNGYPLEYGYCKLLKGEFDSAKKIFYSVKDIDLRADWAYLFIQFMNNYIQFMPSYLQIRNFLEVDIGLLIRAQMAEQVENVINASDIFYKINQESYKFIARAMLNYNYPTIAKIFLNKGVEKCYNDPELHFLYGNYHLLYKNTLLAKSEFENCLEILPNYYPAVKMLKNL